MSELVAFLNARLDEDDAAAEPLRNSWVTAADPLTAAFSHRFDAKRALREVAAGRVIISQHEGAVARQQKERASYAAFVDGDAPVLAIAADGPNPDLIPGLELAIRVLCSAYSDHPDYRSEWASGLASS